MIKYLGIIPARKNSTRVRGKNLIKIGNKKLIHYTFDAALKSKSLNDLVVTTDDTKIINYAKKYKIKAPFKRPKNISNSKTPMEDVVIHLLNYYKKNFHLPKNFVLLQPTSPFRTSKDIDNCIKRYEKQNSKSMVSVSEPFNHPYEILTLKKGRNFFNLSKNSKKKGKEYYFINGSIYICSVNNFLKTKKIFNKKTHFFKTSKINSIDLNDMTDLKVSRSLLKNNI